MLKDTLVVKAGFEKALMLKFGNSLLSEKVNLLTQRISGKDRFVDGHLHLSLLNILGLDEPAALHYLELALRLSEASAFAPVLFLEKIPTLEFYDLREDIGHFLANILNHGARAVSMFLGSDHLRTEDLIDILEQASLPHYKHLLRALTERHADFGVNCSVMMRFAAKIGAVVSEDQLDRYLDICLELKRTYGIEVSEKFIRHTHELIPLVPLSQILNLMAQIAKRSHVAVAFAISQPKTYFASVASAPDLEMRILTREQRTQALASENYALAFSDPTLDQDRDFAALVLCWPDAKKSFKENVIFQLSAQNYQERIMNTPGASEIQSLTQGKWWQPWLFGGEKVDASFIRTRVGKMLQDPRLFSVPPKTILNRNKALFDRSEPEYTNSRVMAIVAALLEYCTDREAREVLQAMTQYLDGNRIPLRNLMSRNQIVVEACQRNPWSDYGRADELFSCTGIGQYAEDNAPGFLADMNLMNLDLWSDGLRVGRMHFCLVKGSEGKPLLLLDCVDGSDRITESPKKFAALLEAARAYAVWLGFTHLKVNCDVDFNTTPKKFIACIEEKFESSNQIDLMTRLVPIRWENILLAHAQQTFLESFQKSSTALVKGPILEVQAV